MKKLKKVILTGVTAASILGTAVSPFAATKADAASNNQNYKSISYSQNYRYNHLIGYNQAQITEYKLRFIQLGYNIYDQHSIMKFQQRYHLHADGMLGQSTISKLMAITYAQSDVDLLARTIYMKTHNQSFNSQVGVGAVILNRVYHKQFPNTIHQVISTDNYFKPILYKKNVKPDDRAYKAAYYAIQGNDPTHDSLYVYTKSSLKTNSSLSLTKSVTIGQSVFLK